MMRGGRLVAAFLCRKGEAGFGRSQSRSLSWLRIKALGDAFDRAWNRRLPTLIGSNRLPSLLCAVLFVIVDAHTGNTPGAGQTEPVDKHPGSMHPGAVPPKIVGFPLASACPSPIGLQHVKVDAAEQALDVLDRLLQAQAAGDLHQAKLLTDQAYWPEVQAQLGVKSAPIDRSRVGSVGPAASSPYADLIEHACGKEILQASLWASILPAGVPQEAKANDLAAGITGHFFLIQRHGHWLVWGSKSG